MKKMELPEFAYKCILFLLSWDDSFFNIMHFSKKIFNKRAISSCWYFVIGSDELYYKWKYRYVCEYIISCTCMET